MTVTVLPTAGAAFTSLEFWRAMIECVLPIHIGIGMDYPENCLVFRARGERILCLYADETLTLRALTDPNARRAICNKIEARLAYALRLAHRPAPLEISTAA